MPDYLKSIDHRGQQGWWFIFSFNAESSIMPCNAGSVSRFSAGECHDPQWEMAGNRLCEWKIADA